MKKLILSALVLMCTGSLMAADRTTNEMKAIAAQQLLGAGVKAAGQGQALKLSCVQEDPTFAIYAPENGAGFVVVSRDDAERPVLGYSLTTFDANGIPSNLQWWLRQTAKSLEARRTKGRKAPVLTPDFEPIAPFMTSKWGQGDPFNSQTPEFMNSATGQKEHAPTGCVATAMAQIMNYNRWPESAKFTWYYFEGTHPEYDTYGNMIWEHNEEIGASIPKNSSVGAVNSTYTWPLQDFCGNYYPDGYAPGSGQSYQYVNRTMGKKLSTLMRDCGYAVGMEYSADGSGAQIGNASSAFVNFFQYPTRNVKYRMRANLFDTSLPSFYTDNEWLQMIANELRLGGPILYGGQDDEGYGGHAFVLHGMDIEGRVYVNWGWNGKADGYYAIDHLNTDLGKFNTWQDMVLGIRQESQPSDDYESLFVSMAPYSFSWDPTQYYSLQLECENGLYNYSYNDFFGQIYAVFEDLTSGETIYELFYDSTEPDPDSGETANPIPIGYGWSDFSGWCETELEPGHIYRAYIATKTEGELGYSPVRVPGGAIAQAIAVDAEGEPSFGGYELMEVQEVIPTDVKTVRSAESQADASVTSVYDIQGRLVHRGSTSSFNLWDIPARGVLVVKQGDKVRKVIR